MSPLSIQPLSPLDGRYQAQVAALVLVAQGVQRHQALNLAEKQAEYALRFETGLQLQSELLAQLSKADGAMQKC